MTRTAPSRLCTICARGGSKGVLNKNLRLLAGRPLLSHSIDQAKATGLFRAIAVSSDSPAILDAALAAGADLAIRRPDALATDTAPKLPAIRHAAAEAERELDLAFATFVDLDATSPLRLPEDITGAVALLESRGIANVLTGAPAHRSPYFNLVEVDGGGVVHLSKTLARPIARRQDAPRCYDLNASIYVWRRDALMERDTLFLPDTALFEMPEERSRDIDSELDFRLVEFLLREQGRR